MKFSETLKKLRKQNGFTQDALAKQLNVSKSTISMYENGERIPPSDMMERIADLFRVSINALYGREDTISRASNIFPSSTSLSPRETALIIAYRTHPNEQPAVDKLLDVPTSPEEIILYNAAYFGQRNSEGIIAIPGTEWQQLKETPSTDQDLS